MNPDELPPERPTYDRLRKLIALAEDVRGETMIRKAAKRKLALYHKHFPSMLKRNDPRKD